MEPIRESSRERRMQRALLVLEGMTLGEDSCCFSSAVYRIAHAGLGLCCAGGNGEPWLDEIEAAEKSLKAANIVDVERHLSA